MPLLTQAQLLTSFADNTTGNIRPTNMRDFVNATQVNAQQALLANVSVDDSGNTIFVGTGTTFNTPVTALENIIMESSLMMYSHIIFGNNAFSMDLHGSEIKFDSIANVTTDGSGNLTFNASSISGPFPGGGGLAGNATGGINMEGFPLGFDSNSFIQGDGSGNVTLNTSGLNINTPGRNTSFNNPVQFNAHAAFNNSASFNSDTYFNANATMAGNNITSIGELVFNDSSVQTTAYTGGGGGNQNLSSVLTQGNDGGGNAITDVSSLSLTSGGTSLNSNQLNLDPAAIIASDGNGNILINANSASGAIDLAGVVSFEGENVGMNASSGAGGGVLSMDQGPIWYCSNVYSDNGVTPAFATVSALSSVANSAYSALNMFANYLPLAGGTMTGGINLNGNTIDFDSNSSLSSNGTGDLTLSANLALNSTIYVTGNGASPDPTGTYTYSGGNVWTNGTFFISPYDGDTWIGNGSTFDSTQLLFYASSGTFPNNTWTGGCNGCNGSSGNPTSKGVLGTLTFPDNTVQTTAYSGSHPNLSSVLGSGNDAGGQSITDLSSISAVPGTSGTPSTFSITAPVDNLSDPTSSITLNMGDTVGGGNSGDIIYQSGRGTNSHVFQFADSSNTVTIGASGITFPDSTTQTTAGLPLTGGTMSNVINMNGNYFNLDNSSWFKADGGGNVQFTANGFAMNVVCQCQGINVPGQLADGSYPTGSGGNITITNGVITAIS